MIFVTNESKQAILAGAVKAREEELMHYQINIDNYKLAIEEINKIYPYGATDEELTAGPSMTADMNDNRRINAILFSRRLQELLVEHELEFDKADIMLRVLLSQLEGVDISSLVTLENQT
jgi:hypothetical protein